MSQEVKVFLKDDLDGGDADETVQFALGDINAAYYEIDLSTQNADNLRKALQPYLDAARKIKGRPKRKSPGTAPKPASSKGSNGNGNQAGVVKGHSAREVRDWARSNGLDVPEKGRIPQDIADKFADAHAA